MRGKPAAVAGFKACEVASDSRLEGLKGAGGFATQEGL